MIISIGIILYKANLEIICKALNLFSKQIKKSNDFTLFIYFLDLDNDNVIDLNFSIYNDGDVINGRYFSSTTSVSSDSNIIAVDSLNSPFVKFFSKNDLITSNIVWRNLVQICSYYVSSWNCPPSCPGSVLSKNNDLVDKYIVARIIKNKDTIYSWIKISTLNGPTISDFATQKKSINKEKYVDEKNISLYPNPFTKYILYNVGDVIENYLITVTDISGREMFSAYCNKKLEENSVDLGFLKPGIYLFRFQSNLLNYSSKIVKIEE